MACRLCPHPRNVIPEELTGSGGHGSNVVLGEHCPHLTGIDRDVQRTIHSDYVKSRLPRIPLRIEDTIEQQVVLLGRKYRGRLDVSVVAALIDVGVGEVPVVIDLLNIRDHCVVRVAPVSNDVVGVSIRQRDGIISLAFNTEKNRLIVSN